MNSIQRVFNFGSIQQVSDSRCRLFLFSFLMELPFLLDSLAEDWITSCTLSFKLARKTWDASPLG